MSDKIMQKEFYFIRHGETDHNRYNVIYDESDIDLNEMGRFQAEQVEAIIAELPIKSICFSPMKRAKHTKTIVCQRLKANEYEIKNLAECTGEIWVAMTHKDKGDRALITPFYERILKGMNEALDKEGPALIVAHGGVYIALCHHMNLEAEIIGNCQPVHFAYDANQGWSARKLT